MKYSFVVKHKKEVAMYMKNSSCTLSPVFLYFTTQSCTSCTLSPLFYVSLQSCTSCTLSPRFYISLHRAVLLVHFHLFFMFHYTELYFLYIFTSFLCFTTHRKRGDNVHEVQLCVVKHKNEVTIYMKYSFVVKYEKEVTTHMKYSSV
jgi:hypothetical protein